MAKWTPKLKGHILVWLVTGVANSERYAAAAARLAAGWLAAAAVTVSTLAELWLQPGVLSVPGDGVAQGGGSGRSLCLQCPAC